jgi:hypothetical protein
VISSNWEINAAGFAINSLAWAISTRCDASAWRATPALEVETTALSSLPPAVTIEPQGSTAEAPDEREFNELEFSTNTANASSDIHILIVFAGVGVVFALGMYVYVRVYHRSQSTNLTLQPKSTEMAYAAGPYPQLHAVMEQTTL